MWPPIPHIILKPHHPFSLFKHRPHLLLQINNPFVNPLISEMGFRRNSSNSTTIMLILVLLFAVSNNIQQLVAIRPLIEGYASAVMEIQSLQRGPVPPSGSSPCTYIPERNHGRCTLADPDQMGVANAPPAFPEPNDHVQNSSSWSSSKGISC